MRTGLVLRINVYTTLKMTVSEDELGISWTLYPEENVYNRLICITRWYGGQHIGPVRFDIIKGNVWVKMASHSNA